MGFDSFGDCDEASAMSLSAVFTIISSSHSGRVGRGKHEISPVERRIRYDVFVGSNHWIWEIADYPST